MSTTRNSAIDAELLLYYATDDALIGGPTAATIAGISRTTFDALWRDGRFPQPVRIADTRVLRWRTGDVRTWVRAQAAPKEVAA